MFITGIGTALPPRRYTQVECWEFAKSSDQVRRLTPRSQAVIRKVLLGDNGIESRYLALDSLNEIGVMDPDAVHRVSLSRLDKLCQRAVGAAVRRSTAGFGGTRVWGGFAELKDGGGVAGRGSRTTCAFDLCGGVQCGVLPGRRSWGVGERVPLW